MSRRNNPPKYCGYNSSGQAIVTLADGMGGRRVRTDLPSSLAISAVVR